MIPFRRKNRKNTAAANFLPEEARMMKTTAKEAFYASHL